MPFALGGGDLVPDPFPDDLPLELGKGQKDVEGQPAHAGGGVEGLGDRDEGHAMPVEQLHQPGEVGQGPGQPVDLVDDHDIDLAGCDFGQERLQGRPVQGGAGYARRRQSWSGTSRQPSWAWLFI